MSDQRLATSDWAYWLEGRESVRLLSKRELWGSTTEHVLVPSDGSQRWVRSQDLWNPSARPWTPAEVTWRGAAARALHLMARGEPAAVKRGRLVPLPHQLEVVERALALDSVRLLLADEVGLGKTIEAGLILSELKARGRARRVLVVAPKGVQLQWVAEMQNRFEEEFARVGPEAIPVDAGINPWRAFDRVVCSLDAVKPIRRRVGWSEERLATYNDLRFRAIVEAGWDLVIFDEAHHVAGSTEDVARHELARELAARSPHVLLLSATPHSGKSEAFARLLGLLDGSFLEGKQLTRDSVTPLVVRTEKRDAVDQAGRPLFQARTTSLERVRYGDRQLERRLYEAVTDYVREGYNRARQEKRNAIGFLLLLMQRLVSSSSAAILRALEKRAAALTAEGEQIALFAERAEQWGELSGEDQYRALMDAREEAWGNERREVAILLDLARKVASSGIDAKAEYLLKLLRSVQREDGDPGVKFVIFTEFVPTQEMLLELLENAGIPATAINGDMSLTERALAQAAFEEKAQVLVSTDAGGEGINLQFAHVVINYDLPWNPMRIEQRIGRVDRIGQKRAVKAFNLVLEDSVDEYVLEVLEEKLQRILKELGADKWDDVLETTASRVEDLYAQAITDPAKLEREAARLVDETKEEILDAETFRKLISSERGRRPPRERDRVGHLLSVASRAFLEWKGETVEGSLLLGRLPETCPPESVPEIKGETGGLWMLWEVRPEAAGYRRDTFGLFVSDDGTVRPDLAEQLWLGLVEGEGEVSSGLPLGTKEWEKVQELGADYGYSRCRDLDPKMSWQTPRLVLRLLVRVIP